MAERLIDSKMYWSHWRDATSGSQPSANTVYRVAMTYIARFDPNGRGCSEEEHIFGFKTLTWGGRKADIDPDMRATIWVSLPFLASTRSCFPILGLHLTDSLAQQEYERA